MKIVFCGPPHSGKSVFIANLIDKLPTDAYTIIRACPDGEGTWSNNKNQNETSIVRKKGKFTKSFIDDACKAIDNQTNKIVLVDVGGVMSKENEQVFEHCDSFVVLSSDEQKKQDWLDFGEKLGLECIGSLDSSLDGNEEIYSRTPYFQGKIVGLERGELLENSSVINGLVSDIIKKRKKKKKTGNNINEHTGTIIDDTELGFELGYGKEIYTEDGTPIKKVKWPESSLPEVYKSVQEKAVLDYPLLINGIRANFVLSTICKAAKNKGIKKIKSYDIRSKQYIPIRDLPMKKGIKQTEGLAYNIIENNENTFIDIDITKEQYSLEDYSKCVLPKIKEDKNIYLSGRMPLWLSASISNSYDSNKIFTFQPGKGFTCVSSRDANDLGTIVDGINGININKYFEDKKESNKTQLPSVLKSKGLFSKIKGFIYNIKKTQENSKYVDNSVIANIVNLENNSFNNSNSFKTDLQSVTTDKSNLNEHTSSKNTIEQKIL